MVAGLNVEVIEVIADDGGETEGAPVAFRDPYLPAAEHRCRDPPPRLTHRMEVRQGRQRVSP